MINFHPYTKEFKHIFKQEKEKIKEILPQVEVQHIGSTAVEGLGGKGIVDMIIGLDDWGDRKKVKEELKSLGYIHIHPEENGRIFMSKKPETGYKDVHLHLVKKGGREYQEKLTLRDYLRENPSKAEEYENLKKRIIEEVGADREEYREMKKRYLKDLTNKSLEN